MSAHTSLSGAKAADRLALRELVDAYASCADRRDAKGQIALFTEDTHFVVYLDAKSPTPSSELHRRDDLAPVFDDLNKHEATHISWGRVPSCWTAIATPEKPTASPTTLRPPAENARSSSLPFGTTTAS